MTARLRPIALLGVLLGGCYEYLPARSPASLVGQRVQVALTDSGSVVLASQIGPSVESFDAMLLSDGDRVYRMGLVMTRMRSGTENDWRGETIQVPHTLVASLSERRFSVTRSVFAGALATVGVVGATIGLRGNGSSSSGSPTTGGGTKQ